VKSRRPFRKSESKSTTRIPRDPDHPELGTIHDILEAYEVLSDPDQRVAYNHQIQVYTPEKTEFNYRHFLQGRPDDNSQAKLVFYDILQKKGA
jgi:curved DNA-binding protein CbpA